MMLIYVYNKTNVNSNDNNNDNGTENEDMVTGIAQLSLPAVLKTPRSQS